MAIRNKKWTKNLKSFEIPLAKRELCKQLIWTKNLKSFEIVKVFKPSQLVFDELKTWKVLKC